MKRNDFISHCEREVNRWKNIPSMSNRYIEHKIFFELLNGKNIHEIFDENDEYINK